MVRKYLNKTDMITQETIKIVRAIEAAGQKIVRIFNESNGTVEEFYIVYTEFNFVDNSANKLDVRGKDITDMITKGTFMHNITNDASFRDQLLTVLGGVKEMRMEFSHHWKWVNFIPVH